MWSALTVLSILTPKFSKSEQISSYRSRNIETTKQADHILELSRLRVFVIINFRILLPTKIRFTNKINAANYLRVKDDLQFVMLLSCFVEHPPGVKTRIGYKTLHDLSPKMLIFKNSSN